MTEKRNRVWWDEELDLPRVKASGVFDETAAREVQAKIREINREHPEKLDWIMDLSGMTKATSKARKVMAEVAADPDIRRHALIGASVFIRTVANFISAAVGQKNVRHFATEEEALQWIREGR